MSEYPLIIIGGGLSGLAAGIRYARFGQKVLILEKHSRAGGLNSYYHRGGRLFETGLHAVTNFAPPGNKQAPLNRLLRQLKLPRHKLTFHEQQGSEVLYPGHAGLRFNNDFSVLRADIQQKFPAAAHRFDILLTELDLYDAFTPQPRISARARLIDALGDECLADMLLCPLLFYGGSEEGDLDFSQFVIMFRAIYQEGFFRPGGTMKDFLHLLLQQYRNFGGTIRFQSGVRNILFSDGPNPSVLGVELDSGEQINCAFLLSTIGYPETLRLSTSAAPTSMPPQSPAKLAGRLSFVESIYILPREMRPKLTTDRTIIFYNRTERFLYRRPKEPVDLNSGVICFPDNFHGLKQQNTMQLRVTHLANYQRWGQPYHAGNIDLYRRMKEEWTRRSREAVEEIIGKFEQNIVYEDTFTPVTIERFTSKSQGAVYGSPVKLKDGRTPWTNLFLAGTDQGFLGIVGSMLSGISMVNAHILNKQ